MLKGLRKRETYDELINELGDDPIKKYPDRRASQIENSNYMSQLALGFQEVIEQNDRVMKEKTKQLLLQDAAGSSSLSHKHLATYSDHGSSLRGKSLYGSAESYDFIPDDKPLVDFTSHQEAHEALAKKAGIPMRPLLSSIVDDTYQLERSFLEQAALMDTEHERDRQIQQLRLENMAAQVRANDTQIHALPPPPQRETASSSSTSAPVRLAIHDATYEEQHPELSSDEELIPAEPQIRPVKLVPREEEVRHLFKPKRERTAKPKAYNEKIYRDTFAEWNKEGIDVLKEQITYRPGIKLTKTEFGQLTKPKALQLIRAYDNDKQKSN